MDAWWMERAAVPKWPARALANPNRRPTAAVVSMARCDTPRAKAAQPWCSVGAADAAGAFCGTGAGAGVGGRCGDLEKRWWLVPLPLLVVFSICLAQPLHCSLPPPMVHTLLLLSSMRSDCSSVDSCSARRMIRRLPDPQPLLQL